MYFVIGVRVARLEYKANRSSLRQLSDNYYNSVATRRERRANLQCMWTLLQVTRGNLSVACVRCNYIVSQKTFPSFINRSFVKHYPILIIFGNIPEAYWLEELVSLPTLPNLCFYTTWGNKKLIGPIYMKVS